MIDSKQTVRFEAFGQRFQATAQPLQRERNSRGGFGPSFVSMDLDLVDRPGFDACDIEWAAWKKAALAMARPIVEAALALFGLDEPVAFSAKRICSCGCSPAWIMESSPNHVMVFVEACK